MTGNKNFQGPAIAWGELFLLLLLPASRSASKTKENNTEEPVRALLSLPGPRRRLQPLPQACEAPICYHYSRTLPLTLARTVSSARHRQKFNYYPAAENR